MAGVAAGTSHRFHFHVIARLWMLCQEERIFASSLGPLFQKRGFVVCFLIKSYIGNCPPVDVVRRIIILFLRWLQIWGSPSSNCPNSF